MSDQGKWFKLWESSLDDSDLENLSIHEWFCWARFGVYLKKHGTEGKIRLRKPGSSIINLMRVKTFEEAINMLKRLPNYIIKEIGLETVDVTNTSVSEYFIACKNWNKYQGDFSGDRVKKFRERKKRLETANVTAQEEKRREVTSTSTSTSTPRASLAGSASAPPALRGNTEEPENLELKEANRAWQKNEWDEIPESERMTPEEMRAIRIKNMGVPKL